MNRPGISIGTPKKLPSGPCERVIPELKVNNNYNDNGIAYLAVEFCVLKK
jgi:hypothetical protein